MYLMITHCLSLSKNPKKVPHFLHQAHYLGLVSWVVSLRRGGVGRLVGDERFSENGGFEFPAKTPGGGGCACCGDVAICMGALSGSAIVGGGLTQLAWVWRHISCLSCCCCCCI